MPYPKLFHGRERPDEQMENWGEPGPVFGPFPYFHVTYGCEIKFDDDAGRHLHIVDDVVYYDGMFYGDWSVFDGPPNGEEARRLTDFDPQQATLPEKYCRCSCMTPSYFHSGVPGILAYLENGRLPRHGKVERCDQCRCYPDDESAFQQLVELGLVWETGSRPRLYTVHCYVSVRIPLHGIPASTPQDAARIANAMFDWDTHQVQAEFADEMNEFLVDVEGADDFSQSRRFNAHFEDIEV